MARKSAASQRARRLADLIQRELSMLLFRAYSNHSEPGPTITSVDVSSDLSVATIWVTQMDTDAKALEKTLNEGSSHWRKLLAPALSSLHKMPQIRFRYDESLEKSLHIHQLISQAMSRTSTENAPEETSISETN